MCERVWVRVRVRVGEEVVCEENKFYFLFFQSGRSFHFIMAAEAEAEAVQVIPIDDFHTHLRQGSLMKTVTPLLQSSGVRTAYVMV